MSVTYQAAMEVFDKLGFPRLSEEEYWDIVELPYITVYERFDPDVSKDRVDELFSEAVKRQGSPVPYDGAEACLEFVEDKDLIVISSHPEESLREEAEQYGFKPFFDELYGSVSDKREVINGILSDHGWEPGRTGYVGDMRHDVEAGNQAGVVTVGVTWGYQDGGDLAEENPDRIVSSFEDLLDVLQ